MIIRINEDGYVESPYIQDATIELEITLYSLCVLV